MSKGDGLGYKRKHSMYKRQIYLINTIICNTEKWNGDR